MTKLIDTKITDKLVTVFRTAMCSCSFSVICTFFQTFFYSGVPSDVVGDFNYYNPNIEKIPSQHPDFANETGTQN